MMMPALCVKTQQDDLLGAPHHCQSYSLITAALTLRNHARALTQAGIFRRFHVLDAKLHSRWLVLRPHLLKPERLAGFLKIRGCFWHIPPAIVAGIKHVCKRNLSIRGIDRNNLMLRTLPLLD